MLGVTTIVALRSFGVSVTAKVLQDLHTRNLVDPTASMAVSSCRAPKSKLTSNLDGRLIFPF